MILLSTRNGQKKREGKRRKVRTSSLGKSGAFSLMKETIFSIMGGDSSAFEAIKQHVPLLFHLVSIFGDERVQEREREKGL